MFSVGIEALDYLQIFIQMRRSYYFQFMQVKEERVVSPEQRSHIDNPPNGMSDVDLYPVSLIESSSRFSPLNESSDSYSTLSPFARLKLKRRMEDSYFRPISQSSSDVSSVSSLSTNINLSGPSAFRNVSNTDSSQNDINSNKNKHSVNLIKLHQIKSAFSLSEDRDVPTSAVSLGHMFALKKRIIKREEELNNGETSGSDGLSEPSFDSDSSLMRDVPSENDRDIKVSCS